MKSLKNHLSLITALATILFTLQIFTIAGRSLESHETRLADDYSLIAVSSTALDAKEIAAADGMIESSEAISPEHILDEFKDDLHGANLELLKTTLPKFYRIRLKHFPTPGEITRISSSLLKNPQITRVEDFAENHDMIYKLLYLFQNVITVFAVAVFAVTALLIIKELRIWQFQHSERMNIMALFGAPVWLRSAVLYRLAIVDALTASLLVNGIFFAIVKNGWVASQLGDVGISADIYRITPDGMILFAVALGISLLLATLIVAGHKEEA